MCHVQVSNHGINIIFQVQRFYGLLKSENGPDSETDGSTLNVMFSSFLRQLDFTKEGLDNVFFAPNNRLWPGVWDLEATASLGASRCPHFSCPLHLPPAWNSQRLPAAPPPGAPSVALHRC